MQWYRVGTIAVTNGSAAVAGTGTLWGDVGTLNPGDIFTGPDSKLYEVLTINSNISITLNSTYSGSTASAQAYSILPIGLLPSTLAQSVKTTLATANTALAAPNAATVASASGAATSATSASGSATTATAAATAASGSATAAGISATAAATSATAATSLVAGLSSGAIGYATLALMNADLAHPAGTLALVTADATSTNNIFYTKSGASGTGSWTAASASLLNSILATQTAAAPALATLHTDYSRAGYKYAVIDSSNNIALAVDAAGNLIAGNGGNISTVVAAFQALFGTTPPARSGYVFAITESVGKIAIGITNAGAVVLNNQNLGVISANLTALTNVVNASNPWVFPSGFICVGDSLTAGAGGTPYPTQLATLLGVAVQNIGVGGQISTSIAGRFGGNTVPLLTVTGNQIPASGAVTVSAQSFFLQNNQGPGSILGTLGGVLGTLSTTAFDGSGNPTTTTFTRTTAGSVVKLNTLTPFFVDQSDGRLKKTAILWLGRNNLSSTSQVLADVANAIAGMQCLNKRFVVMGILSGVTEGSGTANYISIQAINSQLQTLYPNNYIDIRETLVNASNPALPYDALCIANDTPGPSLHAAYSGGSLTSAILAADTTLNFTGISMWSGSIISIGSEFILLGSVSGSTASGCTRGYGGSTATTHASGTTFNQIDAIHLSTSGYAVVAQTVFNFLTTKGWTA